MALTWEWKDKVGEATFKRQIGDKIKEFTVDLYEGNAYLIMIYEYEENGKDMYNCQGFFVDKTHMRKCLGIDKRDKNTYGNNIFNNPDDKITKIRLSRTKSRNYKEIVKAFMDAFDDIEIGLYREEPEI